MTRIYDAMRRRAAEQAAGGDTSVAALDPLDESLAEAFPTESFPAESAAQQPAVPAAPIADTAMAVSLHPLDNQAEAVAAVAPAKEALEPRKHRFDRIESRYEGKTVLDAEVSPQSREQYRRLAATLHHAQRTHDIKVIMVTSAIVGEGKTLTSSNIALTLSQSYQKQVLLIDADLRRPSLHTVFGIKASAGLTEGLTAADDHPMPVHQVSPRLGILVAGRPTSDPIAALTSDRMRQLVDEARHAFDWIVLDTPPVALLTDANLVASMVDGALIVVKAGSTPCELVQRAVDAIGRERTLGVVLNQGTSAMNASGYGYYDDYYYGAAEQD